MGINNKHSLVIVYVTKELKERVKKLAKANGTTESEIGRRALSVYLDIEHGKEIVNPIRHSETKILREINGLKKIIQQTQNS